MVHESKHSDCEKQSTLDDILAANAKYAETYINHDCNDHVSRRVAVVAPFDPRLDLKAITGLSSDDAIFIRNAGGRVTADVIRSLVLAIRYQGVKEVFVIHTSDDLLGKVTDAEIKCTLRKNLGPSEIKFKVKKCKKPKKCPAPSLCCKDQDRSYCADDSCCSNKKNSDRFNQADGVAWLSYKSLKSSVIDDVFAIRSNPLISKCVRIFGLIYNFEDGKLCEVSEATCIGKNLAKNCCAPPKCKSSCSSSSSSSSCSSSSSSSCSSSSSSSSCSC